MTRQEYYKLLVNAATDGTMPSIAGDQCLYRGPEGKRCVIGLLIPDEKYEEKFECNLVSGLPASLVAEICPEGMTVRELEMLQEIHDREAWRWSTTDFLRRLNESCVFNGVELEAV